MERSLLSAMGRMAGTLGHAEGAARRAELGEAMVFLAALERDAGGSAEALAHALGALDDLEETRRALGEAYGGGSKAPDEDAGRGLRVVPPRGAGPREDYREELEEHGYEPPERDRREAHFFARCPVPRGRGLRRSVSNISSSVRLPTSYPVPFVSKGKARRRRPGGGAFSVVQGFVCLVGSRGQEGCARSFQWLLRRF